MRTMSNLYAGIVGKTLIVHCQEDIDEGKIIAEPSFSLNSEVRATVTITTETGEHPFYDAPFVNGQGHTELPGDSPRHGLIIYDV